jgi:hypothetical protein
VYGGFYAVSRVLSADLATMGWQTSAWSGGQWDPRAVLRQLGTRVWGGNADVDLHAAHAADFGQWPRPSVPVHHPRRFQANGTVSLHDAALQQGLTVSGVVWLTAQHKQADTALWRLPTSTPGDGTPPCPKG